MPFGIVKNAIDPVKQYEKEQKQYLKAQKEFAFLKSGKVRKPRAPYRRLTEDEKNMRALDKALRAEIRYSRMKNPDAPKRKAQTTFKRAYAPRTPSVATQNMRELAKSLKAEIKYSKMKNPNAPRRNAQTTFKKAPITEEQRLIRNQKAREAYVKRKLLKQGRALQALAETIPLPPDSMPFRIARPGPLGGVPRMRSIRSAVPEEML
jgi:hypothetical protein